MIKEYGGKEKYASKQEMKKHEAKEGTKTESTEKKKFGKLAAAARRAKIK